jgi:hypothetical protein
VNPRDCWIWKMFTGLKPFGVAQECGNRDTRNSELVRTVHQKERVEGNQPFSKS